MGVEEAQQGRTLGANPDSFMDSAVVPLRPPTIRTVLRDRGEQETLNV